VIHSRDCRGHFRNFQVLAGPDRNPQRSSELVIFAPKTWQAAALNFFGTGNEAHRQQMPGLAGLAEPSEMRGTVAMRFLSAIFNQAISHPIVPKTPWWRAAALATASASVCFPIRSMPRLGAALILCRAFTTCCSAR
jgi:hypothetical protein